MKNKERNGPHLWREVGDDGAAVPHPAVGVLVSKYLLRAGRQGQQRYPAGSGGDKDLLRVSTGKISCGRAAAVTKITKRGDIMSMDESKTIQRAPTAAARGMQPCAASSPRLSARLWSGGCHMVGAHAGSQPQTGALQASLLEATPSCMQGRRTSQGAPYPLGTATGCMHGRRAHPAAPHLSAAPAGRNSP